DRAHKISQARRRTCQAQRAAAQSRKNILDRERRGHWHARVMPAKGMQPMRIGSGNQRFAKASCHFFRTAIWIEQPNMKMAVLNRVKTIDLCEQPRSDSAAKDV